MEISGKSIDAKGVRCLVIIKGIEKEPMDAGEIDVMREAANGNGSGNGNGRSGFC